MLRNNHPSNVASNGCSDDRLKQSFDQNGDAKNLYWEAQESGSPKPSHAVENFNTMKNGPYDPHYQIGSGMVGNPSFAEPVQQLSNDYAALNMPDFSQAYESFEYTHQFNHMPMYNNNFDFSEIPSSSNNYQSANNNSIQSNYADRASENSSKMTGNYNNAPGFGTQMLGDPFIQPSPHAIGVPGSWPFVETATSITNGRPGISQFGMHEVDGSLAHSFHPHSFPFNPPFYDTTSPTSQERPNFAVNDTAPFLTFYEAGNEFVHPGSATQMDHGSHSGNSIGQNKPALSNMNNSRGPRVKKGQVMVLKESGDMISESCDEPSDSYRPAIPRRYMCNVCHKRFTRPSTLKTHMNSHTGERPYPCPTKGCEWKFTVLSNLKRHMRICNGIKRVNSGSSPILGNDGEEEPEWRP